MKAFEKSSYKDLDVAKEFNNIIFSQLDAYDGKKKEQLKSFLEDLQNGGCQSGLIGDFVYNADCKEFYIQHLDDLEEIKQDFEDSVGEPIENRQKLPHYVFMCWLCFEEYCYNLYSNVFES